MRKKDIYEMLNEVALDTTEFSEIPAEAGEALRVKNSVMSRVREEAERDGRKRKGTGRDSWKRVETGGSQTRRVAAKIAACFLAILVGGSAFGLTLPTYAKEIPLVGDIFRYLDNGRTGRYDHYQERSLHIDMTKERNGLEITLNDGIWDGTTFYLTYTIRSDKDLGDHPQMDTEFHFGPSAGVLGWGGTRTLEKVQDGVYVGMETVTIHRKDDRNLEELPFTWSVGEVYTVVPEGLEKAETIGCGLHYNVCLTALESQTEVLSLTGTEPERNVQVGLDKLVKTEVNTILYYTIESDLESARLIREDWRIRDDLGNLYETEALGGSGRETEGEWRAQGMISFGAIDPQATELTVEVALRYAEIDGEGRRIWSSDTEYLLEDGAFQIPINF